MAADGGLASPDGTPPPFSALALDGAADLDALHAACWAGLAQAAIDPQHDWRLLSLATASAEGPQLRSVVLRELDLATQTLVFFTDARSPKVAQIHAQPLGSVLAWSAAQAWQLRLTVRLSVSTEGPEVDARWALMAGRRSAQDYLSFLAPGATLVAAQSAAHQAPAGSENAGATQPQPQPQPQPQLQLQPKTHHFAVIRAQVLRLDSTQLSQQGHRRAQFECAPAQPCIAKAARWVQA